MHSEETKRKISIANKIAYANPELRKAISKRQMGYNNSGRKSIIGDKNPNWKGGVTSENDRIRKSIEYSTWRTKVFERDNYTCQFCRQRGGKLNADHIKPFSLFPGLRFKVDNGRTLCIQCHRMTETYLQKMIDYKKKITMKDSIQFSCQMTGISSRMDRTLLIKLNTQELSSDEASKIHDLIGRQIWVGLAETAITKLDVPDELSEFEGQKSTSERLHAVLYVYWNTKTDKVQDFETFRKNYMNKIIDTIKSKLD